MPRALRSVLRCQTQERERFSVAAPTFGRRRRRATAPRREHGMSALGVSEVSCRTRRRWDPTLAGEKRDGARVEEGE